MFLMIEIASDRLRRRRDVVLASRLMASETFAVRKTAAAFHRRMTLETSIMRGLRIRNRKRRAASALFMTRRAIRFAVNVVAELDAESRALHFRVTFAAIAEIRRAESSLPVVAGRTIIVRARMHSDVDLRHRVSARTVTFLTIQFAVTRVAEIKADVRKFGGNPIRFSGFVTGRARTDALFADHFVRRVTLETSFVRIHTRRNCHICACRFVASRAIRKFEMCRMIKFHFECCQRRKLFNFAGFDVRMTDRANIVPLIFKLLCVAACTNLMRCKSRFRRFFVSLMTKQTRNGRMPSFGVFESLEIEIRHIAENLFGIERLKRVFGCFFFLNGARAGNGKISDHQTKTN